MTEICPNCGHERHKVLRGVSKRMGGYKQSEIGMMYVCLKCGWKWRHGEIGKTQDLTGRWI